MVFADYNISASYRHTIITCDSIKNPDQIYACEPISLNAHKGNIYIYIYCENGQ